MKCSSSMEPITLDLSIFWETEPARQEHEDERRHIEAVINRAIKGARAVSWNGIALRGVHRIDVGPALELVYRDEDGSVLADCNELNPFSERLVIDACDGGLVELRFKGEGEA